MPSQVQVSKVLDSEYKHKHNAAEAPKHTLNGIGKCNWLAYGGGFAVKTQAADEWATVSNRRPAGVRRAVFVIIGPFYYALANITHSQAA